jgi:membrane associated rhomboid family serine protease
MVLPVHDVNPVHRTPVVTYALIVVNVVVFLLSPIAQTFLGDGDLAQQCRTAAYLEQWAAIPDELVGNDVPEFALTGEPLDGGCEAVSPPPYDKRPWLSALTAAFLHGGWFHLLGNMLFLYVFGNNVEDRLGRLRFLLLYGACALTAAYGFALTDPDSLTPLVGASGAIAGVLGAYLVLFPRAKVWALLTFLFFLPVRLPAWLVLVSWFALQLLYSAGTGVTGEGGVAYVAHVIGFVLGAALVWRLRGSAQRRPLADPRFGPYTNGRR